MTDPIADMLTRVRNGSMAQIRDVAVPHSLLKESIASILKREGYIVDFKVTGETLKSIAVRLKYDGRRGVITGIRRVSRPGLRRYVGATEIPRVLGGMGTAILSTAKGVMTGSDARKAGVGGELICFVW